MVVFIIVKIRNLSREEEKIRQNGLYLNNLTTHRIVLTSLLLSSKIHEDIHHYNLTWASVVGISVENLNSMESFIMELLNNDLNINISKNKILSIIRCLY